MSAKSSGTGRRTAFVAVLGSFYFWSPLLRACHAECSRLKAFKGVGQ
jgi:hypothetical protein